MINVPTHSDARRRLYGRAATVRAGILVIAAALAWSGFGVVRSAPTESGAAAALRANHGALEDRLGNSPFGRPLHLVSGDTPTAVTGDIHARVDQPFPKVASALAEPGHWCDILILHINTKHCRASTRGGVTELAVSIGRKHDQPVDKAYQVVFAYRVVERTPGYLRVRLTADEGPFGTRDYSIVFDAIPLQDGRTFTHLAYSYSYGTMGRLAMKTYLATIGRDKVGFTTTGTRPDGQPRYIGGIRGVVERNTMRYYLAIEAFLGALSEPPEAQLETRLHNWFAATERHARQLHEVERDAYLAMKRNEVRRQREPVGGEVSGGRP